MTDYTLWDVIEPWIVLVVLLLPLIYAERWVHRHLFGIGYLISEDKVSATRLFYVIFAPGVFLHEFIQYLVAGALNVPIKKLTGWPEEQDNGILRLDFIVVEQEETDAIRAALVAASPFFIMSVLVWYISTQVLDLTQVTIALGEADLTALGTAINGVLQTPNFILWTYLLFAVANSMLPKREEARGFPLILGVGAAIAGGMLILGLDAVLLETFGGPVADTMGLINIAVATILVLDIFMIVLLGFLEDSLERWRGYKMDYSFGSEVEMPAAKSQRARRKKRVAGSDEPLEAGDLLPSIYNLDLPLPSPSDKPKTARPAKPVTVSSAGSRPSSLGNRAASSARPAAKEASSRGGTGSGRPSVVRQGSLTPIENESSFRRRPGSERGTSAAANTSNRARPASTNAANEADEKPTSPARPSGFSRPSNAGSGASPFNRARGAESSDDGDNDKPARPSGFSRPSNAGSGASPFNRARGGESSDDGDNDKPARPSGFSRPSNAGSGASPFNRARGAESSSDGGNDKPAQPSGFSRPVNASSGASPFNRARGGESSSDDDNKPARPARPTGAFNRSATAGNRNQFRPAPRPTQRQTSPDNEEDDADLRFDDIQDDDADLRFNDILDDD